jgi:hypothetical protein
MSLRFLITASLVGLAALPATPGVAQVRQKAQPDNAAPARSFLLPQLPGKTATPRSTTSEEVPSPPASAVIAPAQPLAAPPSPAAPPPRAAITK